jgi:hypothetical protein
LSKEKYKEDWSTGVLKDVFNMTGMIVKTQEPFYTTVGQ